MQPAQIKLTLLCPFSDLIGGGPQSTCTTTGEDLLGYYGYTIGMGVLIAALLVTYALFHIGSYLSLSRLYKKR